MKKEYVHTAIIALAAFAVCKLVQSSFPIPVIGAYLPGGKTATA